MTWSDLINNFIGTPTGGWWFFLIVDALVPLTFLIEGLIYQNRPPKEINIIYGYRTHMARINKETWNFAHITYGKYSFIFGWITLAIAVAASIFVLGKSFDMMGFISIVMVLFQLIMMWIAVEFTEAALKKKFDENGELRTHPRVRGWRNE
ncbi:MAG: SdpI family protein [Clostridium sp.]|jgi:uncharacterized membrane protein|nr:SdpI family protein [Clostridium sp.]